MGYFANVRIVKSYFHAISSAPCKQFEQSTIKTSNGFLNLATTPKILFGKIRKKIVLNSRLLITRQSDMLKQMFRAWRKGQARSPSWKCPPIASLSGTGIIITGFAWEYSWKNMLFSYIALFFCQYYQIALLFFFNTFK